MKLLFLGTGTSTGIPQIACKCRTCVSSNSKDKRLRSSVLITDDATSILIDCGPDLRQQLITYDIDKLDAILVTHVHYDHVGGLDDVRPLGNTKVYAEKDVLNTIFRNMPYCFTENKYPGVPKISLHQISEKSFFINHLKIEPIRVMHADLPILGYRIGKLAYLTDVKTIEQKAIDQLQDLDILVINALRHNEHISHISLKEALQIAKQINAKQTYFTHISHDLGLHDEENVLLPSTIQIAHDGMIIECD